MSPKSIMALLIGALNNASEPATAIAEKSGVPYGTICKIQQGQTLNPRIETVQRLLDYFAPEKEGAPAVLADVVQEAWDKAPAEHHRHEVAFMAARTYADILRTNPLAIDVAEGQDALTVYQQAFGTSVMRVYMAALAAAKA